MSDFQDRAYAESVSFTRGALYGSAAGLAAWVAVFLGALAVWS